MAVTVVLAASIALQVLAAILALRLIRISGRWWACALAAVALSLMAIRRSISLYQLVSGRAPHPFDLQFELLGLTASLLLVVAVIWIASLFATIRASQEALRQSEERYRTLFQGAAEGILVADVETKQFKHANPAIRRLLGYSEEELKRMNVADIHPQEALAQVLSEFEAQARGEKTLAPGLPCLRKDGTTVYADINTARALIDGRACNVGFFIDITDRKQAEERAQHLNAVLRAIRGVNQLIVHEEDRDTLIQQACDILISTRGYHAAWIVLLDKEGGFLAANQAGLGDRFSGVVSRLAEGDFPQCAERSLSKGDMVLSDESACADCPLSGVAPGCVGASIPLQYEGKVFGVFTLYLPTRLATDEEEQGLIQEVAFDLAFALHALELEAERERLEQALRQSQKMEVVGTLAGGIAHDFNNLLTGIGGLAELAQDQLPADSPVRDDLSKITELSQRGATLTRQLLAFARRQVLEPHNIDLNDVVEQMSALLERTTPENIDLKTHLEPALSTVRADPGQMEHVILNLVLNAQDAMSEGGTLLIETSNTNLDAGYCSRHPWMTPGPYVMLAVSDTGEGMTPEVLEQLFEPFFTTKTQGTGMGLAMAYGIVKQHAGSILAYSEVGEGSTLKVYLPAVEAEAERLETTVTEEVKRGTETIMVVEDDEAVRGFVRAGLESCGYRVIEAADGEEALEVFGRHREEIDLVFLDTVLPKRNGYEVAKILQERMPGLRVLFTSGYSANALHERFVLKPGVEFIPKPFSLKQLTTGIRRLLDLGSPSDDDRTPSLEQGPT